MDLIMIERRALFPILNARVEPALTIVDNDEYTIPIRDVAGAERDRWSKDTRIGSVLGQMTWLLSGVSSVIELRGNFPEDFA